MDRQQTSLDFGRLDFELGDLIAEARRELQMRLACYPRWIESGRLKPEAAQRQLALQTAIVRRLEVSIALEKVLDAREAAGAQIDDDDARLPAVRCAIERMRAAEVGGCFRPEAFPEGDCAAGDCYCMRQCTAEAVAALRALDEWAAQMKRLGLDG